MTLYILNVHVCKIEFIIWKTKTVYFATQVLTSYLHTQKKHV